jgi:hypothetical protein
VLSSAALLAGCSSAEGKVGIFPMADRAFQHTRVSSRTSSVVLQLERLK